MACDHLCIGLQETFIEEDFFIETLWRGNIIFSPGSGNSKGCITLLGPDWVPEAIEHFDDHRGHIARIKYNEGYGLICNIYAPNGYGREKMEFFEGLFERITTVQERNEIDWVIVLGDFNVDLTGRKNKQRQMLRI
jgi:exonuclease III